jgi:hypothetical protein
MRETIGAATVRHAPPTTDPISVLQVTVFG